MRNTRRVRITVTAPANREQAGVVPVTFLQQYIECPLPSGNDRKTRSTIPDDLRANQVFERLLGGAHVLAKSSVVERGYALMRKTVGGDLMSGRGDSDDHFRPVL